MTIKSQILQLNNGYEPTSFNEVANCIMNSIRYNIGDANELLGFAWEIAYRDYNVSHTHSKKRYAYNDHCMYGRVWIRLKSQHTGWAHDLFENTLSYTGTGGVRLFKQTETEKEIICYSYDFSIMIKDWPVLDHVIRRRITFNKLANSHSNNLKITHQFTWTDPDVRLAFSN